MTTSPLTSNTGRRGFSLVELVMAVTLMVGVVGSLAFAAERGLGLFHDSGLRLELRSRAQKALGKASSELLGAGATSLTPDLSTPVGAPPAWTSDLLFTRGSDWLAGAPVLTPPIRLVFELETAETDDGTDENGNGLIDEGRLVLVIDDGLASERRTVIGTGIAEFLEGELPNGADDNGNGLIDESGFCVSREGRLLVLRVTTERAPAGAALMQHTEEIAVGIRND